MEERKQIEEMADFLWHNTLIHTEDLCRDVAETLCAAGYRKQVEGEWKRSERSKYDFFCTVCGEKAVRNIYGNHDRLFKFCPHCGAKMKGE